MTQLNLKKEAEEYADKQILLSEGTAIEYYSYVEGYITGATSEYVKQQILLGQIEVLEKLKLSEIYNKIRYVESYEIDFEIQKLKKQLE